MVKVMGQRLRKRCCRYTEKERDREECRSKYRFPTTLSPPGQLTLSSQLSRLVN